MANVYLSVLGTTDYKPCTYYVGTDFEVPNVRFVQEASAALFCRDWTEDDRILIFTTDDAYKKNWLDNGHEKNGKILERDGLVRRLNGLKLKPSIRNVMIREGHSEDEIWEIFQTLYDNLADDDVVTFDITHSFRSIPLLILVVLNYAKVVRNVSLNQICYGAFEVLGPPYLVDTIPLADRRVPILDLTAFDKLLDWSLGIHLFVKGGNASICADLARKGVEPVLRDTGGANQGAKALKKVAEKMDAFSKTLATCRGRDISRNAQDLTECIASAEGASLLPAFGPLLGKAQAEINAFGECSALDGVQAAKWCLEHNLTQQAYTILSETMITHVCELAGNDPLNYDERKMVNEAGKILALHMPQDDWIHSDPGRSDKKKACLEILEEHERLWKTQEKLIPRRNDLNHSGWRPDPAAANKFGERLKQLIEDAEEAIKGSLGSNLPTRSA